MTLYGRFWVTPEEMTLGDWKARLAIITQHESSLLVALNQNARTNVSPKFAGAYGGQLAADIGAEHNTIELSLAEVRADKEMQEAAGPIVAARAQQIEEANRRLAEENRRAAAEESVRAEMERDAQQDRFEASPRGMTLYSVLREYWMRMFILDNPSPLPSERTAGETAAKLFAKCTTRQLTPKDPDNMSADEKAAIDMIITDLPRGKISTIRNNTVARILAAAASQCTLGGGH